MPEIRAILFDWGNTLAHVPHEDHVWSACASAAMATLGSSGVSAPSTAPAEHLREAFVAAKARCAADPACLELNFIPFLRSWLDEAGHRDIPDGVLQQSADAFWNAWTTCFRLVDGADAVLRRLAGRGFLTALVSNVTAPPLYCVRQLHRLGLLEHLHTLSFSSEVGIRKPRAEIYQHALQKLRHRDGTVRTAGQVLFVGDSPLGDVAGPAGMGMSTALLVHPDLEAPWPPMDYRSVTPTYRISSFDEMERVV